MAIVLALILAPFTFLTFCFVVELFVGVRPLPRVPQAAEKPLNVTIIVPAHDEEAIIAESMLRLKEASAHLARIILVADNCSDATAKIARQVGVDVIERRDPSNRGKGFALDFARRHLRQNIPDVVLVIDADCTTDAASIEHLAARCAATARPCQAIYLQRAAVHGSPALQVSTFAFFIKNVVRQRARQRLTGGCHLLGTGMALPWPLFDRANLATANIVEDLELGLDLADAGHKVLLVEDASVWTEPATQAQSFEQRRRWEGGYLQSALRHGPRELGRSFRRASVQGIWAAINLMIPPIALLVILDGFALAGAAVAAWLTGAEKWPLLPLPAILLLAVFGLALAWRAGGSRFVTVAALVRIPLYLVWKLPLYVSFARSGAPKEWLRTDRSK